MTIKRKDITIAKQTLPWERQKNESEQAYHAFCTYRDMVPVTRHKTSVVKTLEVSGTLIHRWATQWAWDDRVREYDNYMQAMELADRQRQVREMNKKHLTIAYNLQIKAAQALEHVDIHRLANRPEKVLDMFVQSVNMERRILDQPDSIEQKNLVVQHAQSEAAITENDAQRIQAIRDTIDALREAGVLERIIPGDNAIDAEYRVIEDKPHGEPCGTTDAQTDEVHAGEVKPKADGVLPTG